MGLFHCTLQSKHADLHFYYQFNHTGPHSLCSGLRTEIIKVVCLWRITITWFGLVETPLKCPPTRCWVAELNRHTAHLNVSDHTTCNGSVIADYAFAELITFFQPLECRKWPQVNSDKAWFNVSLKERGIIHSSIDCSWLEIESSGPEEKASV